MNSTLKSAITLIAYFVLGVVCWAAFSRVANSAPLPLDVEFRLVTYGHWFPAFGTGRGVANFTVEDGHVQKISWGTQDFTLSRTVPLTDPNNASLQTLIQTAKVGPGAITAPVTPNAEKPPVKIAVKGSMQFCVFFPGNCAVNIPLTINGTRGIGLDGTITWGTYADSGARVSLVAAPWTINVADLETSMGEKQYARGWMHGPDSFASNTHEPGGLVVPVTPVSFRGGIEDSDGYFVLKIKRVPEPGKGLLLLAGCFALAVMGRNRARD